MSGNLKIQETFYWYWFKLMLLHQGWRWD